MKVYYKGNLIKNLLCPRKVLGQLSHSIMFNDKKIVIYEDFVPLSIKDKLNYYSFRKRNDDALWLQILKKEEYMYGQKEVLMEYRIRQNSVSSNKLSLIKYHWQLYREIEHLSIARSIFHIVVWGFIKVFHIK